MTLFAAYQTLLYRYSGQDDLVVGTPIAGRNQAGMADLIGFVANTIALGAELEKAGHLGNWSSKFAK